MKVEHYGKNAVEVDGVLVSYEAPIARIGRRAMCRLIYHRAIEMGYFRAARILLRNALIWSSPTARSRSMEWVYDLRGGKLYALEY